MADSAKHAPADRPSKVGLRPPPDDPRPTSFDPAQGEAPSDAERIAALEAEISESRDKLLRAVSELVSRAQAAGAIRADIGPGDVSMLFSGVAHATAVAGDFQPVLRERFVRIILDGLRAADP